MIPRIQHLKFKFCTLVKCLLQLELQSNNRLVSLNGLADAVVVHQIDTTKLVPY